jgi:acetylglutamate kinase
VLDADGRTIAGLARHAEQALTGAGTVSRGMLAKLHACRDARRGGVADVAIVDGRDAARLRAALEGGAAASGSMTRVL